MAKKKANRKKVAKEKGLKSYFDDFENSILKKLSQTASLNAEAFLMDAIKKAIDDLTPVVAGQIDTFANMQDNKLVFPQGTKYIFSKNGFTTVVVEQQPHLRTIECDYSRKQYTLPFPYLVTIANFRASDLNLGRLYSWAFGFSNTPITSLSDKIYATPMSWGQFEICLGEWRLPAQGTVADNTNALIRRIWQTPWSETIQSFKINRKTVSTLQGWADYSNDPLVVLNGDWSGGRTTEISRFIPAVAKTQVKKSGVISKKIMEELQPNIYSAVANALESSSFAKIKQDAITNVQNLYDKQLQNLYEKRLQELERKLVVKKKAPLKKKVVKVAKESPTKKRRSKKTTVKKAVRKTTPDYWFVASRYVD